MAKATTALAVATVLATASASPTAAEEATTAPGWSYTFGKSTTQQMFDAASHPATLTAICAVAVPSMVKPFCGPIGVWASGYLRETGAPRGRCLHVYARVGWPPVGGGYRSC